MSSFSKNSLNIASYNPRIAKGLAKPTITVNMSNIPKEEVSGKSLVTTGNNNKGTTLFKTLINP
jgi:hypothetical protein